VTAEWAAETLWRLGERRGGGTVLSERDEQLLLEAEEQLRRDDDRLVRAFEAFARCGEAARALDPRDVLHPRDVRELSSTSEYGHVDPSQSMLAALFYRACRVLFMVAFLAMLAGFLWVLRDGDAVVRLLSVIVLLPVIGLLAVAVMVLDLERRR
jgi:hypothetical protein